MSFQTITTSLQDDTLVITILESRIYLAITDVFSEEIHRAIDGDYQKLIVNMENVTVMNSSGIGVLIKTRDELMKLGKPIKLISLQPLMKDIFSRMRLDTLFEIEYE